MLTVSQAADAFGVTPATIVRWIQAGLLLAVHTADEYFIDEAELAHFRDLVQGNDVHVVSYGRDELDMALNLADEVEVTSAKKTYAAELEAEISAMIADVKRASSN